MGNPESIAWIDSGVLGMRLLPLREECSYLLVLAIVHLRGHLPEYLKITGGQLMDFSTRVELSQTLTTALPRLVEMAIRVLAGWNVLEARQTINNQRFT